MMLYTQLLDELGFKITIDIEARRSIADLIMPRYRCGVYILHFLDGSHYVGQAVDVTRRFVQHKKNFIDISAISFRPVNKTRLSQFEKECIQIFERYFEVRNISLACDPKGDADLDLIFTPDAQDEWLKATPRPPRHIVRNVDSKLRKKYTTRFAKLMRHEMFSRDALPVMKKYLALCMPEPFLTEITFWGCSCLPQHQARNTIIYSRINIRWQEVFTVGQYVDCGTIFFSWHLSEFPFEKLCNEEYQVRYGAFKTLDVSDHYYDTGGADQFNMLLYDSNEALLLLEDDIFVTACKIFNLRNMRKGALAYANSHCMDLADIILPCPKGIVATDAPAHANR